MKPRGAKRATRNGVPVYLYKGYELYNHGYYPPDRCVWWEAINPYNRHADHHATTKGFLMVLIDESGPATRD